MSLSCMDVPDVAVGECSYRYINTHKHIHTHIHTHTYYTYINIHIYIYIHTHIHDMTDSLPDVAVGECDNGAAPRGTLLLHIRD